MNNKLLYKIHITGRVQGVGFRWITVREARNRDITGYVKNLDDGSVEIEAEGYKEQLDAFVEWCRQSPGHSIVESVTADPLPAVSYSDFTIRY
jgi:acylphosphatase